MSLYTEIDVDAASVLSGYLFTRKPFGDHILPNGLAQVNQPDSSFFYRQITTVATTTSLRATTQVPEALVNELSPALYE
jgi:hypothetical protein